MRKNAFVLRVAITFLKYGKWSLSKNSVFVILRLDRGIQKVLKTLDSRLSSFVVLRRTGRENDNFIWEW